MSSESNKQQKKKGRITRLWRYLWGSSSSSSTVDVVVTPHEAVKDNGNDDDVKVVVNDASMFTLIDSLSQQEGKKSDSFLTQSTINKVEEEFASIRSPHVDDDFIGYLNDVVNQLEKHNLSEKEQVLSEEPTISESKVGFAWTDINVEDYLFENKEKEEEHFYPLETIVVGDDEIVSYSNSDKRRISNCVDDEQSLKRHKLSTSTLTPQKEVEIETPLPSGEVKNVEMSAEFSENTCEILEKMERGELTQDKGTMFKNMRMVPKEEKMRRLEFEESIRKALDKVCGGEDDYSTSEDDDSDDDDTDGVVNVLCREFEDIVQSVSGFFKNNCRSPVSFQKVNQSKKDQ